ncbi:Conserved_hypothetical protein [Hexamita inflata]|uniref:Uncharacterized protein n=2 Tax=Hexamita inflata TaxID=28002 RepID=A0AA86V2I9_9EUKA|nr:Conserved hypothetical protein [Hexamita inflata]
MNIQKCQMCIIVVTSHIDDACDNEKSLWTALIPHPLVVNGSAAVKIFFVFAGIFSMHSMKGLYEKHENSTKDFIKAFLFQYTKRYFSTHAVLFAFGLGYIPFLYWVFGENGRDVYYHPWSQYKNYWITWFLPVYLPWRPEGKQFVSTSGWFSQVLTNHEFFFYIFYFCAYFLKKYVKNVIVWGAIFLSSTLIFSIVMELLGSGCRSMSAYAIGVCCYFTRVLLTQTEKGKRIIDFAYSKNSKILAQRWGLSIFFIYLWMFMCRSKYGLNEWAHVIYSFFFVFDIIPFPKFSAFWQQIINEIARLSMVIYILHFPFLHEAAPRNFPYVTALNFNIEKNHSWINAFSGWIYLLIFGMLSYPLWFMQRPLELLPVWLKHVLEKKHLKDAKKFKTDLALSLVGLGALALLIILAQCDVFGHAFVQPPPHWPDWKMQ